ncbi:transposase InsO family protein [Paraburkholderia youngii]
MLRRVREDRGVAPVNAKRVYRVMRVHGLLLQRRPSPPRPQRRHDGKVAVAKSTQRWCSDGFEFRCDNGEPLRVTFALDCCDREAMSWAATTGCHSGDVVRDVMLAAVENGFGNVSKAPAEIEWLTDNGSGYTADRTRSWRGDCWDTQSKIRLERRTDLTRAGIGRAALALTCRSGSGVPRALPGPAFVT